MKNLNIVKKGILVIAISALISACNSKITSENYEKVKAGMSYREVEHILGEPNNTTSLSFGNVIGLSASWEDPRGSITVQFFNDKVKLKNFNSK